jgi:hypothetical protein
MTTNLSTLGVLVGVDVDDAGLQDGTIEDFMMGWALTRTVSARRRSSPVVDAHR